MKPSTTNRSAVARKYYYARKTNPQDYYCDCGQPGSFLRGNLVVCSRCADIEARLYTDFHEDIPDTHVLKNTEPSCMRPARRRSFVVGPFDPTFYGHKIQC